MPDTSAVKKEFFAGASALAERLERMSDGFYRNPETALEEFKTSAAMRALLAEFGFSVEEGVAGMPTAFSATLGSGRPTVALLAEMDALVGIGHGCGHNIGGVASVGAACALSATLCRKLAPGEGTLMVLGTPAEETGAGKIRMIKAGLFDDVDAAMMVHGSSKRTLSKRFLGLVRLGFTFLGRSSHAAAYPEEGINALDAAIQTFNSINALRQQLPPGTRVHGIITDGGRAPNMIPERAAAEFYVRAPELDTLESLKDRVINCARGAATATGCTIEVAEGEDFNAPMKINSAFVDIYRGALSDLGLVEYVAPSDGNAGSSDIGNVSHVVPTIHPHVPIKKGVNIHTHEFADATITPDGHRALMEGVRCLGLTAIELLMNTGSLDAVKEAFGPGAEEA